MGSDKQNRTPGIGIPNRRQFVAGTGLAVSAFITGCLGDDDDDVDDDDDDDVVDDEDDVDDDDDDDDVEDLVDIHILLPEASLYNLVHFYGAEQGVWRDRGIDISHEVTGFGQYVRGFPDELVEGCGQSSTLDLAEFYDEGGEIQIFAPHLNEINHVFVHEDSDIESVPDLEGETLGVAGLGSGTTRTFMGMWDDMYDFDLENDPAEVVDSDSASLFQWVQDGEVDAALMFTGFTISALAHPELRSIFFPVDEWRERTGHPGQVTLFATFDDFLDEHPDVVLDFWDGWVEGVEIFREEFDEAISQYGAISGVDLEAEDEIDVIQEMVDNEEIFPTEWGESVIDSNVQMLDVVENVGGITGHSGAEAFITHEEIEDMT